MACFYIADGKSCWTIVRGLAGCWGGVGTTQVIAVSSTTRNSQNDSKRQGKTGGNYEAKPIHDGPPINERTIMIRKTTAIYPFTHCQSVMIGHAFS
jgi:hypothetical protein